MAAVELDEDNHPIHIRFDPLPDLKGESIEAWARTALHEGVHLVTDGLASLAAAAPVVATSDFLTPYLTIKGLQIYMGI